MELQQHFERIDSIQPFPVGQEFVQNLPVPLHHPRENGKKNTDFAQKSKPLQPFCVYTIVFYDCFFSPWILAGETAKYFMTGELPQM